MLLSFYVVSHTSEKMLEIYVIFKCGIYGFHYHFMNHYKKNWKSLLGIESPASPCSCIDGLIHAPSDSTATEALLLTIQCNILGVAALHNTHDSLWNKDPRTLPYAPIRRNQTCLIPNAWSGSRVLRKPHWSWGGLLTQNKTAAVTCFS